MVRSKLLGEGSPLLRYLAKPSSITATDLWNRLTSATMMFLQSFPRRANTTASPMGPPPKTWENKLKLSLRVERTDQDVISLLVRRDINSVPSDRERLHQRANVQGEVVRQRLDRALRYAGVFYRSGLVWIGTYQMELSSFVSPKGKHPGRVLGASPCTAAVNEMGLSEPAQESCL